MMSSVPHFDGHVPGLGFHPPHLNGISAQHQNGDNAMADKEKAVDDFLNNILGSSLPSDSTTIPSAAQQQVMAGAEVVPSTEYHQNTMQSPVKTPRSNINSTPNLSAIPQSPELMPTLPQIMLFGPAPEQWDTIMSRGCLEKLPNKTLSLLVSQGVMEGTIIKMNNYDQHENMSRLKNYLEQGTYQPFRPLTALEHVDTNGAVQSWMPKKETILQAVNVTSTTQEFFSGEIDFYLFAVDLKYEELRKQSADNIVDKYPKSVQGIWLLVSRIYGVADRQGDRRLKDHVMDLIYANCKDLIRLPQYIPLMKKLNKQESTLGAVLFESYITASEYVRRKFVENQKKEAALATRKETPTKEKAYSPTSSLGSTPVGVLRPEDLPRISQAILDGSLVISMEEGYGTLTKAGLPARNRNFVFHPGELLLANHLEPATNGHNNLIVYNSKGERGDILRQLVRDVPKHLGVLGKGK
jgi:hypothetical protein